MAVHAPGFVARPLGKSATLRGPLVITPAGIDAMLACFTRMRHNTETYANQLQ